MRGLAVFLVAALFPAALAAHSDRIGEVRVGHIWAPPTAESGVAVYVPMMNMGDVLSRLVAIETPIAEEAYLRDGEGGDRLDSLDLPPNQPISLREGQAHIWLEGLDRTLEDGGRFPIELRFEPEGVVEMEVFVESSQGH